MELTQSDRQDLQSPTTESAPAVAGATPNLAMAPAGLSPGLLQRKIARRAERNAAAGFSSLFGALSDGLDFLKEKVSSLLPPMTGGGATEAPVAPGTTPATTAPAATTTTTTTTTETPA